MPERRAPQKDVKASGMTRDGSGKSKTAAGKNQETVQEFIWNVFSINSHLEEVRQVWAQILGVSGPQWLILMAISDLDRDGGVSVKDVSAKLHVDPSFVTTQSKSIERLGFIRRLTSAEDARVVLMSLTNKASKAIANLAARQDELNEFLFSDLDDGALEDWTGKLTLLRRRLEKASLRLTLEN